MKIIRSIKNWNTMEKSWRLIIEVGSYCRDSCMDCPNGSRCKYRKNFYGYHNFLVRIHNFFEYRFKIKLPHILPYLQKHSTKLSGTTKCPYRISRIYTCWDCEYQYGDKECSCYERYELIKNGKWKECEDPDKMPKCKFFSKNKYCDNYNPVTGDIIY